MQSCGIFFLVYSSIYLVGFGWIRFRSAYCSFFRTVFSSRILFNVVVSDWYKYERSFEVINYRFRSSKNIIPQFTVIMCTPYTYPKPLHIIFSASDHVHYFLIFNKFFYRIQQYMVHIFKHLFSRYYLPCSFLNCFVDRSIILLLCLIVY